MIRASSISTPNNDVVSNGSNVRRALRGDQANVNPLRSDQFNKGQTSELRADKDAAASEQTAQFTLLAPPEAAIQSRTAQFQPGGDDRSPFNQSPVRRDRNGVAMPIPGTPTQQRWGADDAIRGQFVGDGSFSRLSRQAIEAYNDNREQETKNHLQMVLGIDTYA
ncbi:MAG: hypothetical protein GXP08_07540 [Gammaproteobacteria bacterium]|nr:hypothetical protein [Gammaproteobacteria bacterium]